MSTSDPLIHTYLQCCCFWTLLVHILLTINHFTEQIQSSFLYDSELDFKLLVILGEAVSSSFVALYLFWFSSKSQISVI